MANGAGLGRVEWIHVAVSEGEPMRVTDRIRVLAGIGLEGDRYATGRGHFSSTAGTGRAIPSNGELAWSSCFLRFVIASRRRAWEARSTPDGSSRSGEGSG